MNIKLTSKQISEIKRLRKKGWLVKKLAEKYNVSGTTISYHAGGEKHKSHKNDGIGDHPEEIPLFIRQNIKKQKRAEPEERIKRNVCVICGGEKERKFRLTHICSFNCFKLYGTQ